MKKKKWWEYLSAVGAGSFVIGYTAFRQWDNSVAHTSGIVLLCVGLLSTITYFFMQAGERDKERWK